MIFSLIYRPFVLLLAAGVLATSAIAQQQQMPVLNDNPPTPLNGAPFELLGISPGDTLANIKDAIEKNDGKSPVEERMMGTISSPNGGTFDISYINVVKSAQLYDDPYLFAREQHVDVVNVDLSTPLFNQRALVVTRRLRLSSNERLSPAVFANQISEKFGKPSYIMTQSTGLPARLVYAFTTDGTRPFYGEPKSSWPALSRPNLSNNIFYISALKPCGAVVDKWRDIVGVKNFAPAETVLDDPSCDKVLIVNLTGGAVVEMAEFNAIDAKRLLQHRQALSKEIASVLSRGSADGKPVVKPRL